MKKLLAILLVLTCVLGLTACSSDSDDDGDSTTESITILIPNDTTNEARALLLLEENGLIELDDNAGITATINDITSNPLNITFEEVEAAQIPNMLQDADYAVINGNYAINAGLNPTEDGLLVEGSASSYVNVLVCKEGNEENPLVLALAAALQSQQVADFISSTYTDGSVIAVADDLTDGYDDSIDYDALAGQTISCAASPTPHADILAVAAEILAEKGITLEIIEYSDYVVPNTVVEDGEVDTNYFQHVPYLDEFNAENGTHLVSVAGIHVEPMALYGGQQTTLEALGLD